MLIVGQWSHNVKLPYFLQTMSIVCRTCLHKCRGIWRCWNCSWSKVPMSMPYHCTTNDRPMNAPPMMADSTNSPPMMAHAMTLHVMTAHAKMVHATRVHAMMASPTSRPHMAARCIKRRDLNLFGLQLPVQQQPTTRPPIVGPQTMCPPTTVPWTMAPSHNGACSFGAPNFGITNGRDIKQCGLHLWRAQQRHSKKGSGEDTELYLLCEHGKIIEIQQSMIICWQWF